MERKVSHLSAQLRRCLLDAFFRHPGPLVEKGRGRWEPCEGRRERGGVSGWERKVPAVRRWRQDPAPGAKVLGSPAVGGSAGAEDLYSAGDEGRRDLGREERGTGGGGGRGEGRAARTMCVQPRPPGSGGAPRVPARCRTVPSRPAESPGPHRGAAAPTGSVRRGEPSPLPAAHPGNHPYRLAGSPGGIRGRREATLRGRVGGQRWRHAASCLEFSTPAARPSSRWKRSRWRGSSRPSPSSLPTPPRPSLPARRWALFPRSARGGGVGRGLGQRWAVLSGVGRWGRGRGRGLAIASPGPHIRRGSGWGA